MINSAKGKTKETSQSSSSDFDHIKHNVDFSDKTRPLRVHLREFIKNEADGYYYTYLYKDELIKNMLRVFRRNANSYDLEPKIFERVDVQNDVQNIKCIRISHDNYHTWKNANEAKKKVCKITDRTFHFDEENNIYYTLPLPSEAGNQALMSVKRGLKNFDYQCHLKLMAGQYRIEISTEAYEFIRRSDKTKERIAENKPNNLTRITEREFQWDESSECYYLEPFAGENMKSLSSTLRESARIKHLDPEIFKLVSKDNRKYYQIAKNDYDNWIRCHEIKLKRLVVVKRKIVDVNGSHQIKLRKGEFAYRVRKSIINYFKSKKLIDISKELSLDISSNTLSITSEGKKHWEAYVLGLNGRVFIPRKDRSVGKTKIVGNRKMRVTKLASQYQRQFIENELYFYTVPREGENITSILHNLNIHSRYKLNRSIFKIKDGQLRVKKNDFIEWKRYKNKEYAKANNQAPSKSKSIRKTHKFISTKYLEDAESIAIPASKKHSPEVSATKLNFAPIRSVLIEKQVGLKQKIIDLNSAGFNFEVKIAFRPGEFTFNHKDNNVIFVRAGRKLNAKIPQFENDKHNCTIMLMMSSLEFKEACEENPKFYMHLPENVQLLLIKKCNISKDGSKISEAELRTSNIKRKVALLFADHFSISDYVLMDDNIDSFSVSEKITEEITPDSFFGLFRKSRELTDYQGSLKPICITAGTFAPYKNIQHPLSAEGLQSLIPTFGSKLMYVHSEGIISIARAKNIPLIDLCSFRDLNWGEDYFWQCALGILTGDDRTFLGRLPFQVAYLQRSDANKNVTLSLPQFKLANEWIQAFDEIQHNPFLSGFQKTIANEMKAIVEIELERRRKLQEALEQPETAQELMLSKLEDTIVKIDTESSKNSYLVDTSDELNDNTQINKSDKGSILKPVSLDWKKFKIQHKGAEVGKNIAATGFDLDLIKLNILAEIKTSNLIDKKIFVQAAQKAHEKIYSLMTDHERAAAKGREVGKNIAATGFDLNLIKLNISAKTETSNLIDKEIFVQAAQKAHEEIYSLMTDHERAVAKGRHHGELCVNKYKSNVNTSDLTSMANAQGEHKQTYLDSFYDVLNKRSRATIG